MECCYTKLASISLKLSCSLRESVHTLSYDPHYLHGQFPPVALVLLLRLCPAAFVLMLAGSHHIIPAVTNKLLAFAADNRQSRTGPGSYQPLTRYTLSACPALLGSENHHALQEPANHSLSSEGCNAKVHIEVIHDIVTRSLSDSPRRYCLALLL